MANKTYDSKRLAITFNGILLGGYADGEFLSVEFDEDIWSTTTGSDGEVARSRMHVDSAVATLSLLQTSDSNAALNAQAQIDKKTGKAAGVFQMVDPDSGDTIHSEFAYIQKQPTMNYDREIQPREWLFKLAKAEFEMTL